MNTKYRSTLSYQ